MAEPLALAPFAAGLTNQKLALLGLTLRARAEGRPAAWSPLLDYHPGAADHGCVPFASVFDVAAVTAAFAGFGVPVEQGAAEQADGGALMGIGGEAIATTRRNRDDAGFRDLCRILAGMKPMAAIAAAAADTGAWLRENGVRWGCQLRIERDWLHWTALHRADKRINPAEPLYVDFATILAKLAGQVEHGATLYVTCNEADLPVEREEIGRRAYDAHRLTMLFRSDVPRPFVPAGLLAGAALDFAIASTLPCFAGHSRSTFFGALALTAHGEGRDAHFWLYNNRGAMLKRRTDHGAFVRPWAAANL
ncbi:hypothetical protein [uncultured Sphingomonas sp.]|uniref:hypothetical protein n=1 Tax=uncultured Sphingomonas sp. TaxID=158754 RepID=UPI0025DFF4CD|nr:hypothetical protein [uncultured Sphingomonas sp.]